FMSKDLHMLPRSWRRYLRCLFPAAKRDIHPVQAARRRPQLEILEDRCVPATFHVSLTGLDTNTGGVADPFRSIQAAINAAAGASDGPDIIQVAAGTYNSTTFDGKLSIPTSANLSNLQILGGFDSTFTTQTSRSTIYIPSVAAQTPATGADGDID